MSLESSTVNRATLTLPSPGLPGEGIMTAPHAQVVALAYVLRSCLKGSEMQRIR
jgi:hypothetical protein